MGTGCLQTWLRLLTYCTYLCVTTPLLACSSVSCCTALEAPRNLNAPLQAGKCTILINDDDDVELQTETLSVSSVLTLSGRFRT